MPEFAAGFFHIDALLSQLIASLPTTPPLSSSSSYTPKDSALCELAVVQTVFRLSLLQLHGPFFDRTECSHKTSMVVASEIVEIAKGVAHLHEIFWHLPLQVCEVPLSPYSTLIDR
jgi:hypothetical protein